MKTPFRGLAAAVFFGVISWAGVAGAAEIIVLDSSVEAIKAGAMIDSASNISVPAGRKITVMEADGSVRTISGPYDGAASSSAKAGGSQLMAGLSKLVTERSERKAVLGAVRAVDTGSQNTNLLAIDVTKSQIFCLPKGANPVLWRPESMNLDVQFAIASWHDQDNVRRAIWRRGDQTLAWPPNLTIGAGADFILRMDVALKDTQLRVHRMPDTLATTADQVVWMAQTGCESQARLLLDQMIESAN